MSQPWGYHRRGERGPRGWLARWWYTRRTAQVRQWQDAETEKRRPKSRTAPVRMDALSIVVRELAKEHGCFVQPTRPGRFEACPGCRGRGANLVEALRREECLASRPGDVQR